MRLNGIHYDIGIPTIDGASTRPDLPVEVMEREIADIAGGLHANAIRITGDQIERITQASEIAARHELEVWLSPMLPNAGAETTQQAIADCARAAEELRRNGAKASLVIGCELSVFMAGIMPGATHADRLTLLADPVRLMTEVAGAGLDPQAAFAAFLASAAATARGLFGGRITYAAGLWEQVDWSAFDVVGIDAYRDATNREGYANALRAQVAAGLPVVATELGCATYRGAAEAGGMGWAVVERAPEARLRNGVVRDEAAQAAEVDNLMDVISSSGLAGAFVFTYVAPSYPSATDPAHDLDTASFALVRSWPDGGTEPKAAYHAVAARYGDH
jgi:hypothetical protein